MSIPRQAGPASPVESATASFLTEAAIPADRLATAFGVTRDQLADTAGLRRTALAKSSRSGGRKAQTRLREMVEILGLVEGWAGGPAQALSWYRAQPIPGFGGRTAEAMVKEGRAGAVRDYLDHLALGGYA
jgi:hypothetical protein